jgi:preprotein translocase subunit SecD
MTISQRATTTAATALLAAFILASATVSATSAPDPAQIDERARAAVAAAVKQVLEMQGGSRLVFKVDSDALREAVVTDLRDDVVRIVREERIPFSGLAMREGGVELKVADAGNRRRLASKLASSTATASSGGGNIDIADSGDGLIRLTPTGEGFAERLHGLVGDSIDLIEQDLRDNGIKLADVQPDGPDRSRVLLPGVTDPERVVAAIARKARIAFRLVDASMSPEQASQGSPPAGSEVLHDFKTKAPYLVVKDIAVDGDDISEAAPGFFPQSQQPIVSFRLNARGTRRFARVTADNIGRPFAVVIDDQVVSAPVIREPITGGSGQISGQLHARRRQPRRDAAALRDPARPPDGGRSAGFATGQPCWEITGGSFASGNHPAFREVAEEADRL